MEVCIRKSISINKKKEIDEDFLESMYRQYYKNVYNYIAFRINNHFDSEDLVSSVFENAIRKFHTYQPDKSPIEGWLIGIAKNVVTDYLRSKKHRFFVPLDEIIGLISPTKQLEEIIVINEENKALIQAMAQLKDTERQVLSIKFATNLKNNQISKILGLSDSNVGVIIHRSIQKLTKIMDKERGIYEK